MLTLELVKSGRVDVLLSMSPNHSMSLFLTKFEKKYFKKNGKEKQTKTINNLGP